VASNSVNCASFSAKPRRNIGRKNILIGMKKEGEEEGGRREEEGEKERFRKLPRHFIRGLK
jgi:hypothetical protein